MRACEEGEAHMYDELYDHAVFVAHGGRRKEEEKLCLLSAVSLEIPELLADGISPVRSLLRGMSNERPHHKQGPSFPCQIAGLRLEQ